MMDFSGKQVFLTGVSGAIGQELARVFSGLGARVVGADRNTGAAGRLADEGCLADFIEGDLTDPAHQERIIERHAGATDILLNNVGAGFSKTLQETTREDFLHLYRLNFEVAAMLCRGFMPEMARRGGGKVINVSTILADNPLPTVSAYAASKAALIAFTRAVALQFAPKKVQANVISPGYIRSPKHAEYFESQAGLTFMERFMPTGALGTESALNGAFLYLASPLSDHVTGQVLKVDGGYTIW